MARSGATLRVGQHPRISAANAPHRAAQEEVLACVIQRSDVQRGDGSSTATRELEGRYPPAPNRSTEPGAWAFSVAAMRRGHVPRSSSLRCSSGLVPPCSSSLVAPSAWSRPDRAASSLSADCCRGGRGMAAGKVNQFPPEDDGGVQAAWLDGSRRNHGGSPLDLGAQRPRVPA